MYSLRRWLLHGGGGGGGSGINLPETLRRKRQEDHELKDTLGCTFQNFKNNQSSNNRINKR